MAGFWPYAVMPSTSRPDAQHGIGNIDLLVVNLYPFEETVARERDSTNIPSRISTWAGLR